MFVGKADDVVGSEMPLRSKSRSAQKSQPPLTAPISPSPPFTFVCACATPFFLHPPPFSCHPFCNNFIKTNPFIQIPKQNVMLQTDSPTSTLLATPRSQIQDLPLQQLSPSSPSPPPSSTLSRRHKSRKNNSSKSLHHRKSVDIKPATPASDQVTIAPSQLTADPTMDWKQQDAANQPIRVDVLATKTGKRFTLPKLFTVSVVWLLPSAESAR